MIITIAGFPGTNTKNTGKLLALQVGMRYVCEDDFLKKFAVEKNISLESAVQTQQLVGMESEVFVKKLSEFIQGASAKNDAIIDHLAAAWILNDADVKIFLHSLKKNRAKKIVEKEKIPMGEVLLKIEETEKNKSRVFLHDFGIDIHDLSIYDLVINVDKLDEEKTVAVIRKFLEKI